MTILELLEQGPLTPAEIARQSGKEPASIRSHLYRLAHEGVVVRLCDGRYAVAAVVDGEGDTEEEGEEDFSWVAPQADPEPTSKSGPAKTFDPYRIWKTGFFGGLEEVGQIWKLNEEAAQARTRQALAEVGLPPIVAVVDAPAAREVYLRGLAAGRAARRWWLERQEEQRAARAEVKKRETGWEWLR